MSEAVHEITGLRRARWRVADALLEAERERLGLWMPVFYGTGIAVYFALATEPTWWVVAAVLAGAVVALWMARGTTMPLLLCVALAIGATGFSIAKTRTAVRAAPVLAQDTGFTRLTGRIVALETRARGRRAVLDRVELRGVAPSDIPATVRIRLHARDNSALGDRISLLAKLRPPSAPVLPGGYDFQRRAFFERLGGTGFALEPGLLVAAIGPNRLWDHIQLRIGSVRQSINDRIRTELPGGSGAVATALVTGERGAISRAVLADMRAAGLAHLLAISGLHLGLVSGLIFGGSRLLLAAMEPLALRFAIKKWAAWAALLGSFVYLLLAGGTVPTQRAFIMTGVVLIAVIADRRALSMRMVACAAMIVLTLRPESVLGASFQMSFAAVIALVAAYEVLSQRLPAARRAMPVHFRVLAYLGGVALTTLIAGSATSLFALHHFGRASSYGMLANLVAIPVTALWIMPAGIASVLAMPLGLEGVPLRIMGAGIDIVVEVARWIAGLPGAERAVPTLSTTAVVTAAVGGLWLCLWQSRMRLLGALGPILALLSLLWISPPDLLIAGDGRLIGVREQSGRLLLSSRRAGAWAARSWMERVGARSADPLPFPGDSAPAGAVRCDRSGCLFRHVHALVALVHRADALQEDCRHADIVVARVPVRSSCAAGLVIDRFDLARLGAHAIWIDEHGFRVETVAGRRGSRPWVSR